MAHTYVCERCGAKKVCNIAGCQKDCTKVCVTCLRTRNRPGARNISMWHVDIDVVDLDLLRHELPDSVEIEVLREVGPAGGHPEVRLRSRFRTLLDAFLIRNDYDL